VRRFGRWKAHRLASQALSLVDVMGQRGANPAGPFFYLSAARQSPSEDANDGRALHFARSNCARGTATSSSSASVRAGLRFATGGTNSFITVFVGRAAVWYIDLEMNLRHAAELALVGWYLMMTPSPSANGRSDPSTPLSRWEILGSFDSAQACEQVRTPSIQSRPPQERYAAERNVLWIASDDPRLKEK
jgi:hypothetical protein